MSIILSNIVKSLPKEDTTNYRAVNNKLFQKNDKICIIIDDDPTGNQTVYDVPLLTTWNLDVFISEFINKTPVFFVLTNSRSLSAIETSKIFQEISKNIAKAAALTQQKYTIVSRSDSTLRGHFPLEHNTIKQGADLKDAITVFIPVMFEGGRVTLNDTHYVSDSENLTPVSETPFAQDHSFGYTNSNLKAYVEEKTGGDVKASMVYSFSIEQIRTQPSEILASQIQEIPLSSYCVFNCLNYLDLDKVTNALLLAEKSGKEIIYRTSSSFVPSYIGLKPKGLLNREDLIIEGSKNGGLTIVGSYVKKSSEQLKQALSLYSEDTIVEVDVEQIMKEDSSVYVNSLVEKVDKNISTGNDVIVYTSRKLITGTDSNSTIKIASTVSQALVSLVNSIAKRPRYLIAKGGITSHDLATKGLGMIRSKVLGQLLPGIPVWEMGEETRFLRLPYVVFPGNVGNEDTLSEIIQKLSN